MISKNALLSILPKARELQSNKVEDIQDFLDRMIRELDKQWRLLHQDVSTIQLDTDGFLYFGNKDTLGTWRIGRSGADWVLEHQTTTVGTWITVDTAQGS